MSSLLYRASSLHQRIPSFSRFLRPSRSAYLPPASRSLTEEGSPQIPDYKAPANETIETQRARLLYQSRKRGTLENGILLSTFASRYLSSLTQDQLKRYDSLINIPSNDWDIYYWIIGTQPVPDEYNNDIMAMLKEHAKNKNKELRIQQPALD